MAGDFSLIIRDLSLARWLLGSPGKVGHGTFDVTIPGAGKGGGAVTSKWPIIDGACDQVGRGLVGRGPPPEPPEVA